MTFSPILIHSEYTILPCSFHRNLFVPGDDAVISVSGGGNQEPNVVAISDVFDLDEIFADPDSSE